MIIKNENKHLIYDYSRKINLKYFLRYIFVSLENIFYTLFLNIFRTKKIDKKYKISICAIFKNEAHYLKEWIEFHLLIGVDHFYLYNNNSDDNYLEILNTYIEKGIVTLIDWPMKQGQLKAYIDCIEKYKEDTNWITFIDIDEFIVPNKYDSIKEILDEFNNRPVLKLYWQLFGTSGKIDRDREGLVTEDFTICWKKYDEVGKCIYNTSYGFNPDFKWNKGFHHGMWANFKGINLPPVNCFNHICQRGYEKCDSNDFPIQVNHYFTKSYKEYIEKSSKGDVFFEKNPHNLEFFYRHEQKCEKTDFHIYKYLIKLKLKLK